MKFIEGKIYTINNGSGKVIYDGLYIDYGYTCKKCFKIRKKIHFFHSDHSNYPVGTECVKKFVDKLK